MGLKETNPWFYAQKANHKYITPEDIIAAINAGGDKLEVWSIVLDALGGKACEDWSLCAFVAHRYLK
jgi:hypothetical protein